MMNKILGQGNPGGEEGELSNLSWKVVCLLEG